MKKTAIRTRGWTNDLGWGIVNAGAAVRGALALARDTIPPTRPTGRAQAQVRAEVQAALARSGQRRAGRRAGGHRVLSRLRTEGQRPRSSGRHVGGSRYRFTGKRGSRYSFYIQAKDRAGNVEAPPRADFVIRIRR